MIGVASMDVRLARVTAALGSQSQNTAHSCLIAERMLFSVLHPACESPIVSGGEVRYCYPNYSRSRLVCGTALTTRLIVSFSASRGSSDRAFSLFNMAWQVY